MNIEITTASRARQQILSTSTMSSRDLQPAFDVLPNSAWVRESELVRNTSRPDSAAAPLPFSAPTLWRKVKAGTFPRPTKLSTRVTAWQVGEVRAWMAAQAMN